MYNIKNNALKHCFLYVISFYIANQYTHLSLCHSYNNRYKRNLWTWNMDWSIHKSAEQPKEKQDSITTKYDDYDDESADVHRYIRKRIEHLSDKRLAQLHMPGYPK